jgi:hypothetical protein
MAWDWPGKLKIRESGHKAAYGYRAGIYDRPVVSISPDGVFLSAGCGLAHGRLPRLRRIPFLPFRVRLDGAGPRSR